MVTSPVTFAIKTLNLSPGSHVLIEQVSWNDYEALLEELRSDRRIPRINYADGILELMSPLPAHERPHRIIAYIVTTILEIQNRDWEDFGLTTFGYIETTKSLIFPDLNIVEILPKLIQKAFEKGTSQMLRELRLSLSG